MSLTPPARSVTCMNTTEHVLNEHGVLDPFRGTPQALPCGSRVEDDARSWHFWNFWKRTRSMALLLATCTCAAYATWHQGGIIARGSRSAASTSSLPLVTLRLPVKLGVIRMLEQEDEGSSSGSSSSSSSSSSDGGVAVAVVESGSSRNSKQEETTASEDWSGFLLRGPPSCATLP